MSTAPQEPSAPNAEGFVLERSQIVPRSRTEVFAFFADARNLEALTPPSLRFTIPLRLTGLVWSPSIHRVEVPQAVDPKGIVVEPDPRAGTVRSRAGGIGLELDARALAFLAAYDLSVTKYPLLGQAVLAHIASVGVIVPY